jgi:hypothetical protein
LALFAFGRKEKMKYTNLDGSPIGAVGSLEFLSTSFAIAGIVWIFLLYRPTIYTVTIHERSCPEIVVEVKHSVGSDLKTHMSTRAVDACADNLNVN